MSGYAFRHEWFTFWSRKWDWSSIVGSGLVAWFLASGTSVLTNCRRACWKKISLDFLEIRRHHFRTCSERNLPSSRTVSDSVPVVLEAKCCWCLDSCCRRCTVVGSRSCYLDPTSPASDDVIIMLKLMTSGAVQILPDYRLCFVDDKRPSPRDINSPKRRKSLSTMSWRPLFLGSTGCVGWAAKYVGRNHIRSYMTHQRMCGSIKSIRGANHVNALLIIAQTWEIIFSKITKSWHEFNLMNIDSIF